MNFFQSLKPTLIQQATDKSPLATQREFILQRLLNIFLIVFSIGLPLILLFLPDVIRSGQTIIYILVYASLVAITFLRTIPYIVRASAVVLSLQALGLMALLSYGLSGTGIIFLFGAAVTANVLFNQRVGGIYTNLSFLIILVTGILMIREDIPIPPIEIMANSGSIAHWVTAGLVFIFLMTLIMRSIYSVFQGMSSTLDQQEHLTRQLEEEQASLERRVEERSVDLKKRLAQFEIASQIAREISQESNLENLLNRAVNLIRDRFGFYYVAIFLNNENNQYAVLRAATGEAGRIMLERNHQLKIGEVGMVGYVASRGEARIAPDVSEDLAHFKNPLLPETRSEMALPLRSAGKIIGVLSVQSVVRNAFVPEDVEILQTIADQLAIAFDQARLVDQLKRSVEELEASQGASIQKAWRQHLKNTRQTYAYRYQGSRLENRVAETEQAREAYAQGKPVLKTVHDPTGHEKSLTVLAVPIKIRNQILGVVDIHFEGTYISPDMISLIEGTVNRLAISLENARLLEEIQFRAERERLVNEISSKVRTASDVDSVLRTAIQEIGRSLGVAEVSVQLRKNA